MEQFYKLFLIDTHQRKTLQLCPLVRFGILHQHFQPHLRPDGRGIDYSAPEIVNFEALPYINQKLIEMGKPELSMF